MIQVTEEMIQEAHELIAHGNPEAVGYRLMIYPIESSTKLTKSQQAEFQKLADLGFDAKTEAQKEKETYGTHHGILVSKGKYAYKSESLGGDWVEEGNVVIFDRYTGVEVELPPGSGQKYRFTNDESLIGRMRAK